MVKEFKQYTANMNIIVKNAPIQAYHSISIIEWYHEPLRQVYSIITTKIPNIVPNLGLQMFFKAIINNVGLNKLVYTLLVIEVKHSTPV